MIFSNPETFKWDGAYLSSHIYPIITPVCYLLLTHVLKWFMRNRKPLQLKWILIFHNLILCVSSAIMCVGTVAALIGRYKKETHFEWFFCEDNKEKQEGLLYFWSYIYYLSKFYELFDTILIIIQKRNLPYFNLHIFHHSAVIPMAFMWVEYKQSLHWGGLVLNTAVHVPMYAYYICKILNFSTPWKKYITATQIFQFAISFLFLVVTCDMIILKKRECSGLGALLYNVVFNVTLLFSFVDVYIKNTQRQKKR